MSLTFTSMITGETVTAAPWQEALAVGDHYAILFADDLLVIGELLGVAAGHGPGFFWARGYSALCPEGELGLMCVADATFAVRPAHFAAMLANIQAV